MIHILLTTERGDRGVWQADGSTSERWQVLEFETGAQILFFSFFRHFQYPNTLSFSQVIQF